MAPDVHKRGAEVSWYDPLVPALEGTWAGCKLTSWDATALRGFDAAVIVTAHKGVDHTVLLAADIAVVDSRHALAGHDSPRVWQLGGALIVVALLGKLVAGFFIREPRFKQIAIGLSMVPRGDVIQLGRNIEQTMTQLRADLPRFNLGQDRIPLDGLGLADPDG